MSQTIVAGHIILGRIGAGGMGEVFLAEDVQLRRRVALKFLSGERLEDRDLRARFLTEARSAAALNHPNICTIYQVGEVDVETRLDGDPPRMIPAGTPFLAMELVEGETLDQILGREGPLAVEVIREIAGQIAEGLAEAHRQGIVHRDLKPQNIMRTRTGRIKILDFGLAKSLNPVDWSGETVALGEVTPPLTIEGSVVGTPSYMSPEQAAGHRVSFSSDIFSFGLILSEMATGQRTFGGVTAMSILAKIIEAEPEPLVRPDLPPFLIELRNRCLRKNPAERFQNGEELLRALAGAPGPAGDEPDTPTLFLPPGGQPAAPVVRPRFRKRLALLLGLLVVVAAGTSVFLLGRGPASATPTLAVLPFRNVGPADREYVAQGLTEEVTTRLSVLRGLGVVSSTSALGYKDTRMDMREIARELNVQYLLEGSLQWSEAGQIGITCRLVRGDAGTNFWTGTFQADADRIFNLQAEIAEQVAQELDIRLLEPARRALTTPPTENAEAYDFYLRGNDAASRDYQDADALRAAAMFQQAVEKEPDFALAYARLSLAESWIHWAGFDVSPTRLARARAAAERALELEPELPEGQLALGYYYYRGERNYQEALDRFESVRERLPNNSALFFALGAVHRRRGDLAEARAEFERAFRLDPRSHVKAWEAGETLRFLREFEEADRYYGLALELEPEYIWAVLSRGELRLLGEGDPVGAAAVLDAADPTGSEPALAWLRVACRVFQEDYPGALETLSRQTFDHPAPPLVFAYWIHTLAGEPGPAREAADTLRTVMQEVLAEEPEEPDAHSILGLALAGLGDAEGAVREAERAVALSGDDALDEAKMRFQLAWTEWALGNRGAAYEELETLLAKPSWITRARLRIDPTFRDAREDPAFRKLVAEPSPAPGA